MSSPSSSAEPPTLIVAHPDCVASTLCSQISSIVQPCIEQRGRFTIALSGGSLPKLLAGLKDYDGTSSTKPNLQFHQWWVLLADERVVPTDDPDSNLGSIQQHLLSKIGIPTAQVIGIDQSVLEGHGGSNLDDATKLIAQRYESNLLEVLGPDRKLDLAVLGFGPDGHTCSLFPGHALLQERTLYVAPIYDSPKPPPHRITLTYRVLNGGMTRNIIVCGKGPSKYPIVKDVFDPKTQSSEPSRTVAVSDEDPTMKVRYYENVVMTTPPPYPSAMANQPLDSLVWLIDDEAFRG